MCECILGFMRFIVITLAVVMSIVGLITLIGGILAKDNEFLKHADSNQAIFLTGLIFGLVTMLFSVIGIIGVCKGNRCCITMFCIILGVMTFVLIILAIVIAVAENKYKGNYENSTCTSNSSFITDLKDAYTHAATLLCTSNCPCNYKEATSAPNFQKSTSGPVNVVKCAGFNDEKYGFEAVLLRGVEEAFKCSGICSDPQPSGFPKLFYFSDVNNNSGVAKSENCEDKLWKYIKDQMDTIKLVVLIMMIISIVAFIFIIILCIVGKKKGSKEWGGDDEQPLVH